MCSPVLSPITSKTGRAGLAGGLGGMMLAHSMKNKEPPTPAPAGTANTF